MFAAMLHSLYSVINVQEFFLCDPVAIYTYIQKVWSKSHVANKRSNNQLRTEKSVSYYSSFVAILHLLNNITDKYDTVRDLSAMMLQKKAIVKQN